MRPVDVVLRKLERVSEGVVDMRLCREVQDGVDFLFPQEVQHQVRRAYVSLHELPSRGTGAHGKQELMNPG